MEKMVTITKEEYSNLVTQTTAEIMAEYSGDAPEATLLLSLASIAFSAALARKLFPEDGDNE